MQIQLLSKNFRALAKLCFSLCQALTYAMLTLGRSERLLTSLSLLTVGMLSLSSLVGSLSERKL